MQVQQVSVYLVRLFSSVRFSISWKLNTCEFSIYLIFFMLYGVACVWFAYMLKANTQYIPKYRKCMWWRWWTGMPRCKMKQVKNLFRIENGLNSIVHLMVFVRSAQVPCQHRQLIWWYLSTCAGLFAWMDKRVLKYLDGAINGGWSS